MSHRFNVSCAMITLVSVVACGGSDPDESPGGGAGAAPGTGGVASGSGGATPGTGGTTTGTGGALGSGGATGGTGGGGGGTGGSTGGGSSGSAFTCPPGSESLTLDPADVMVGQPIATPPDTANERVNLEGPVWIDGALYASQLSFAGDGRILKYTPGGSFEVLVPSSGTNGLAVDANGTLYAARQTNGSVSTFDIQNPAAAPVVVVDTYEGAYFKSPNDLALRSDGVLYFSDPDWQEAGNTQSPRQTEERAYWVDLQGTVHAISPTPGKPNGVILSADESTLYIGGNSVMKYDVAGDGSVSNGMAFASGGSDGFGMDCAGNLYTTDNGNIRVFSPEGTEIKTIQVGSGLTNVAFGGPNRTTLYITQMGVDQMQPPRLYSVELNVPGFPY